MKKIYIIPTMKVVALCQNISLLAGSEISGGGNLGDYEGGQESRGGSFWDDDDE